MKMTRRFITIRATSRLDRGYSLPYHSYVRKKEADMQSIITSKYQTTVPKAIRQRLGLEVSDALEWSVENGKAVVAPIRGAFLRHRNTVAVGSGDIADDIERARHDRVGKYR